MAHKLQIRLSSRGLAPWTLLSEVPPGRVEMACKEDRVVRTLLSLSGSEPEAERVPSREIKGSTARELGHGGQVRL